MAATPAQLARGKDLFLNGDERAGLLGCSQCHGPTGFGSGRRAGADRVRDTRVEQAGQADGDAEADEGGRGHAALLGWLASRPMTAVAVVWMLASRVLYTPYLDVICRWGIPPLVDQRWAGFVMFGAGVPLQLAATWRLIVLQPFRETDPHSIVQVNRIGAIMPRHPLSTATVGCLFACLLPCTPTHAAPAPAACPPEPTRVMRSAGGVIDYLGTVPGIPDLCRMTRSDGAGDFYYGAWRSDWPGAGQAYPVLHAVITGEPGTRLSFVTRSYPGLQWTDSYTNEGIEPLFIDGKHYAALRLAHERDGIDGNTYHSIITTWRDTLTGVALKAVENQISGDSYGPATTWTAVKVEALP